MLTLRKKIVLVSTLLVLILGPYPTSHSAEPVYSDTNLPRLLDIKFSSNLDSARKLTVRIQFIVETKVNQLRSISTNFFVPARDVLEPPCGWTSNSASAVELKMSDSQLKANGVQEFVLERTFDSERVCHGTYSMLDPKKSFETQINLIDTADHYVQYKFFGNPNTQAYKNSPLWSIPGVVKPNCQINPAARVPEFLVCDEGNDLVAILSRSTTLVTKDEIVDMDLKAKLIADAQAKAKADADEKEYVSTLLAYENLFIRINALKIKFPSVTTLTGIEEKLSKLPIVKGSDLSTAKYNIDSINRSLNQSEIIWSKVQKTTIVCIKGKLTKKVTGIKPKCPSGYKKK